MKSPIQGQRLHFMGIGGIGMSALAEIAAARGAVISGCDREENENTLRLRKRGYLISLGHEANHAAPAHADRVIYTSAVPEDHPERQAADERGMRRGTFLAELMRGYRCIGICGTHGKTTTAWLTAQILIQTGFDPTVIIGGIASELGGNMRLGQSDLFVAELDESDGSFLEPRLLVAVITNLESEHLHYYGDFSCAKQAFQDYAKGVGETPNGVLIAGVDSPHAAEIFAAHQGSRCGFGLTSAADIRGEITPSKIGSQQLRIMHTGQESVTTEYNLPGTHNVQNALAAVAAVVAVGVAPAAAIAALKNCTSVGRRLQRLGQCDAAEVYDDYAHHPTEIRAAIQAARTLTDGKIMAIFQPHLYSRTRDYAAGFAAALATADSVVLADIYPAREAPLPGISANLIVDLLQREYGKGDGAFTLAALPQWIRERQKDPVHAAELILVMGAGNIWEVAHALCK